MPRHGPVRKVRFGPGRVICRDTPGDLQRNLLVWQANQQRGQLGERLAEFGLAGEKTAQLDETGVDVAKAQLEVGDDA